MYYSFSITTEKDVDEGDPTKTELKLTAGIIILVRIRNHKGNRGTLHLRLFKGGHCIWPQNPDGDFLGDGIDLSWTEFYEVKKDDNILVAHTWNDSDVYAHECIVDFAILPRWVALPLLIGQGISSTLSQLIGAVKEL
jgi:hypothetical protein